MAMPHGSDGVPGLLRPVIWSRILIGSAVLALLLGTVGYCEEQRHADNSVHVGNALYHTLQLFLLHSQHFHGPPPWQLEVARWLAPMSLVFAAITQLHRLVREERGEAVRRSLRQATGHVVVCGLGRKGIELVRFLHSRSASPPKSILVIDRAPAPDLVAEVHALGGHVVAGDATREQVLREAGVTRATRVFAICAEDSTNCEIAVQAARLERESGKDTLECYVHLATAELGQTLQPALASHVTDDRARLHAVDAFDPEALELLVRGLPLDHGGVAPDDPRGVRLVILGFGRMGRALAVRAAQLGQFANDRRLRIEVIDRHATANGSALLFHHPQIREAADLEFHEQEAVSRAARNLIEGYCRDTRFHTSIAICFDDETLALEICLQLLPAFDPRNVRVAVRMEREGGLASLVERLRAHARVVPGGPAPAGVARTGDVSAAAPSEQATLLAGRLARLEIFGTAERLARLANPEDWPLEKFAHQIHDAYVSLTHLRVAGEPKAPEAGASARVKPPAELQDWKDLPHDLKDSSRLQAAHIYFKVRAVGYEVVPKSDPRKAIAAFRPDDAVMLAKLEHARWNAERWVAGWVHAKVKNVEQRESPHLVPWDALPPDIQEYDHVAVARIPLLLDSAGMKMVAKAAPPSVPPDAS
jgi:hypothetical protein